MIGRYKVVVKQDINDKLEYEFVVERKYTIVRGDSGTGKTQLFEKTKLRDAIIECYKDSSLATDVTVTPIDIIIKDWYNYIKNGSNTIFIIDEDFDPMIKETDLFESALNNSMCYFILITRLDFKGLAYGYKSIFRLNSSQKYGVRGVYTFNTFYKMYMDTETAVSPKVLIIEDSGSGYTFFCEALKDYDCEIVYAGGKDKVRERFKDYKNAVGAVCGIVDGAGFGSSIEKCLSTLRNIKKSDIFLILPESFEYLLLEAGAFNCNKDWVQKTYDYCDADFFNKEFPAFDTVRKVDTWEDFYTYLLRYLSKDYGRLAGDESKYLYDKGSSLNKYYFRYCSKVLENLKDLVL